MVANMSLPQEFSALEPFSSWCLSTENARRQHRLFKTSFLEMKDFYNAVLPQMEKIAEYLEQYSIDKIPESAKPLYYMMLSFADIAPYVEYYKGVRVPDSFNEARFEPLHGEVIN